MPARWLRIGIASGMAAAMLACGSGSGSGDDAGPADDAAAPEAPVSPVLVSHVPAGFRAVAAGRGTDTQDWGNDETEGANPYTVLAPPGEDATSDRAVVVSNSGLAGSLGRAVCCREDGQAFQVGGREALFFPAGHGRSAQLAVVRGPYSEVVEVTAAKGSRAALVAIAGRVWTPADHTLAPIAPNPPSGLRVLGSVDAGARAG